MTSTPDGIAFRRNRLPQWRLDGGVYFITWRLEDKRDRLSPQERGVVADCIRYHKDQRYRLNIFVVMDDHVHLLIQTLPGHDLSMILRVLKGYTARQINKLRGRTGVLWQKDSYTQLLGNWPAIETRREYVYENPRRKWGIEPHTYEWLEYFE